MAAETGRKKDKRIKKQAPYEEKIEKINESHISTCSSSLHHIPNRYEENYIHFSTIHPSTHARCTHSPAPPPAPPPLREAKDTA